MGDKKLSVEHTLLKKHECHGVTRREGHNIQLRNFFKNSRLEEWKLYLTIPPLLMGGDVQLSVRNEKYEYYSNKIKCYCEPGSI